MNVEIQVAGQVHWQHGVGVGLARAIPRVHTGRLGRRNSLVDSWPICATMVVLSDYLPHATAATLDVVGRHVM